MAGRYEPIDSPDETTLFPYHDLTPPTVATVARARQRIRQHLPETPLVRSEALSEALDADVLLKREDTLPTGAFKVRGGVNLVASLDEEFHDAGLLAASTGNHGQSIAWAGREFDVPVTIGVPEEANAGKVGALEQLGAEVIQYGEDYDEAREHIEDLATQREARYVHSGNEPKLLAGVGTAGLEILDERPDVDRVFCPVGGGTAAAGYCTTLGAMTDADVVGVQAAARPRCTALGRTRRWTPRQRRHYCRGCRNPGSVRAPDRNPAGGTRRFPTRVRRRHYRCRGAPVRNRPHRHGRGLCDGCRRSDSGW